MIHLLPSPNLPNPNPLCSHHALDSNQARKLYSFPRSRAQECSHRPVDDSRSRSSAVADDTKMGALTDQHKRSSTEAGLPHFFSSPKKPRLLLPALTDQRKHSSTESSLPKPHLSPPSSSLAALHLTHPNPFRRPIHAPQRLVRAFCYGSSPTRRLSSQTEMGNFSSNFIRRKHDERFALEEYKKLVEERFASSLGDEAGKVNSVRKKSFSPELSTRNDAEILDGSDVISHKVEDGRNVELELVHVKEERISVKSEPLYKELYDKAKTHDTRLNELNFEVKLLHQKVIQYRIVAEVLRKREDKPKEGLEQLFRPLIAEEEEYISRALQSGSSRKVLVAHESSNIEITREVLQCLRPGAWLNDEVINLYLELLKEREKREPKKFLKCHFFSTFFYKKLISEKHGYDFKAVKRWTTQRKLGYTLIECDKIFVPIHKEIHWCLAVINVKDESFQYLDSLGGLDNYVLKMLARYLKDEVRDKSAKEIDTLSWKKESVDELPLQKNGWDCGMFMLKYADFNSRGLKLCFSQENMPYFRKRTTLEILRLKAE